VWFSLGVAGNSPGTMPANGDDGRHTHEEHLYEYLTIRPTGHGLLCGSFKARMGPALWRDVWNVSVAEGALSVAFCLLLSPLSKVTVRNSP
jgi:hypothetical protein